MPDAYQWEVWNAIWEHEDGTSKERPVLILSSSEHNFTADEIWVAKFTKTLKADVEHRYKFTKGDPSFPPAGLTETCYLYPAEARRIAKSLLKEKRGQLAQLSILLMSVVVRKIIKPPLP